MAPGRCVPTSALLSFVVPLACVNLIKDLGEQTVDAGIVRGADSDDAATSTLAAFGICWYICKLATEVIGTVQQVALVLSATTTAAARQARCAPPLGSRDARPGCVLFVTCYLLRVAAGGA